MSESNCRYSPLSHLQAGDVVAALREWVEVVVEVEDRERVDKLIHRFESALDVVLVEKHFFRAGEIGTILPGDLPEAPQERVRGCEE
jgi:molybdopterin-guanine dinucleotide biosynthesis protein